MESAFLTLLVSIFAFVKSEDPCAALSCSFDKKDDPLLCNWEADKSQEAFWKNGQEIQVYNHLTNIWRDADQRNVNITRGHAEVSGATFRRSDNLILSSPEFKVEAGYKIQFHFKYWLASYGTSLKLCLDKPNCKKPLFSTEFSKKTKGTNKDGPIRSWRPCMKKRKGKRSAANWDCSAQISKAVKLPAGKHKLFFVANGVHKFASIGLDSFTVKTNGEKCGASMAGPPGIEYCFDPDPSKDSGLELMFAYDVLNTGRLSGPEANWDGTTKTCTLLCAATPNCQSVVVYPERNPPECLLYASSCAQHPDSCSVPDSSDEAEYFEKCSETV